MITRSDRYRGCLLGLAAGDALGTTLEFKAPGTFQPITDMMGGGPFSLAPGQWTDDTSMALCLAESLVETGDFDIRDQMQRYVRWYRSGYWSSTGHCFDIGNTTGKALEQFERTGQPYAGSTDPKSAGNGPIMRLAPVPMFFVDDAALAIEMSGQSSLTTHPTRETVDACRYLGGLIVGALGDTRRGELLSELYSPFPDSWVREPLAPKIEEIARGSFQTKNPPDIRGTGYVVQSLEAALWALDHARNFEHGALLAVNLGDDADTTGAVYGQLAGALYGASAIPDRWLSRITMRDRIESLADRLRMQSE